MLYFFYGSDKDTARAKAQGLIDALQKKKPDAELFRIDAENWNEAKLQELTAGQGLFNNSYIIYTASLFENKDIKESFLKHLDMVVESPNIFISFETNVDKKTLTAITKQAQKVHVFEKKEEEIKPSFNIFALSDALGRRDRKKLWVLFRKAVDGGAVPEEVHGILFWQIKSMLLASTAKTAGEAGVAPFVFTKAKSFAKNYEGKELQALSSRLVRMYHDAHRGINDFEIALERFVLTL